MVRSPMERVVTGWELVLGGVGSLAELTDALARNDGDVFDNWYEFAVAERMPAGVIVPTMVAEETRWFRLHCPSGDYSSAAGEPCGRPALAFEHADAGWAFCTMLGTHRTATP